MSLGYLWREPKDLSVRGRALLVLLHGYGSSEADMFALAPMVDDRFEVVAPRGPLTLPGGYAWTEARFTPDGPVDDQETAEQSRVYLAELTSQRVHTRGAYPGGIYMAGFSQGAAMALALALVQPGICSGVVALSGSIMPRYMPTEGPGLPLEGLPIYISHGVDDRVVPVNSARNARDVLQRIGANVTYTEYAMAHELTAQSLGDAFAWVRQMAYGS